MFFLSVVVGLRRVSLVRACVSHARAQYPASHRASFRAGCNLPFYRAHTAVARAAFPIISETRIKEISFLVRRRTENPSFKSLSFARELSDLRAEACCGPGGR